MTVNTEFFLTRHPLLFLFRESCIKSLCCVCVLATVGDCARNIHQLSAVECIEYKFTDEKCRREIAVNNKTDIFLFATDKSSADVITGISEINVYVISYFAGNIKRMLNKQFAEFMSLILGCNAERSERRTDYYCCT